MRTIKLLVLVSLFFMRVLPTFGADSDAIDVKLKVQKIAAEAGGPETLVTAETIRPGDVLQYEIVYKVMGKDEVLELLAQLPIPDGMEYVPDSARPPKLQASVNGVDFSPVPLQRQIKTAMGQEAFEDVPALEYRSLGWPMRGLAPGDELTVSARLRVNFIPESSPGK